ncbi:hypothetical protein B0J18DRAFT_484567 [Chaetomium sp. MPI-SDFR-AT-0129]|nr:hypothetical protein B0J18DRAFT_484567 [Chaetomium sp. MPI-SDFR-AT-0129]
MASKTPPENEPTPIYTTFLCIGTGFSGICLGATLARWYGPASAPHPPSQTQTPKNSPVDPPNSYTLLLLSHDSAPGGTWHTNTYPGAACDVPSALYSYSFAPNPAWTRVLPPAKELCAYLTGVADSYVGRDGRTLRERMVFGVGVERAVWDGRRGVWRVTARRVNPRVEGQGGKGEGGETGEVLVYECRFLFSAAGQFDKIRTLDVPGAETFAGPVFHSARWRGDVDLRGKRVVVFGNGCTAAQIVPSIVGETAHLTQIVRSKHWVYPPVDRKVPRFVRTLLGTVPGLGAVQRFVVYVVAEAAWTGFRLDEAGRRYRERKKRQAAEYMRGMAPEKYHEMLIPDFEIGCKRRIFDSGYLESLHAENLTLTDEKAVEILPHGVRMASGEVVEADVLVLANGFATNQYLGGVEFVGEDGETLAEHWKPFGGPEAYNCTSLSGFPNMFFLLGPNTATGHTSTVMAIENAVNYSLRILQPVLEGRAGLVRLKRSAEEAYSRRMQDALQKTVWMSGCNNWYIRGPGGKVWNGMTYPWSQARYWYECLFPVWRDWEYSGTGKRVIPKSRRTWLWVVSGLGVSVIALLLLAQRDPSRAVATVLAVKGQLLQWKAWATGLIC